MRVIGLVVGVLVVLGLSLSSKTAADTEPNDSFGQAEAIAPGSHVGTLERPGDNVDTYALTAAVDRVYVNVTADAGCTVYAFDGNHDPIAESANRTAHALAWNATRGATYYVMVTADAAHVAYTLVLAPAAPPNPDGDGLPATPFGLPAWLVLVGVALLVIIVVAAVAASRRRRRWGRGPQG